MKLLLHTCCAPCLLYPMDILKSKDINFTVFFYNPNIHPYQEFSKRKNCLTEFTEKNKINLIADGEYGVFNFMRSVVFSEQIRCSLCYDMRLEQTVLTAKKREFSSFSTTLLYSRYQNHALIIKKCLSLAEKHEIDFFYFDFREGWQVGITQSKAMGLYRQPYCGCLYSEQERYDKTMKMEKKVPDL